MGYTIDRAFLKRMNLREIAPGHYRIVLPKRTNMAADTVGRFAQGTRANHPALILEKEDLSTATWTFAETDEQATRLAAKLASLGVAKGSRVAIHTGLRPETGVAHLAIYKLGAIAVTLSQLYGPDTLNHVLNHSEASAIVTQDIAWARFRAGRDTFPHLKHVIVVGAAKAGEIPFEECLKIGAGGFRPVETLGDDPALLMYTSGSTGLPKGMLHGHHILQSYLPSIHMFFDMDLDDPNSVFWSPADWAWVGGLLDLLLAAWAFGHTVVTSEHRFDAEWAFAFMERRQVTHAFLTPTGLKRLAEVACPRARWPNLALRVVCTGGEALPGQVLEWCENDLGVVCNEFYGLTEVNHLIGCCKALFPPLPGSMGQVYPGHGTTVVDEAGNELPPGEVGEIVTRADDATQFLGYWKDPAKTEELRLAGKWLRTRDLGMRDANGYFWYHGRSDDLIKSAGYRIGPAEVEDCLVRHPAVAEAAAVASPDAERGSIVKAFVRLREGFRPSGDLTKALQEHVKTNLAVYKYPREVEYVDRFEMTSSGKINRKLLRQQEIERKKGKGV
jgi:acetyl-CoA synthetase